MRFNVVFITFCVFHVDIPLMIGGIFYFSEQFFCWRKVSETDFVIYKL